MDKPEIDKFYKITWMPTKYLYTHTGKLVKITDTTLILKYNVHIDDEYVNIQKKFIKSIEATPQP